MADKVKTATRRQPQGERRPVWRLVDDESLRGISRRRFAGQLINCGCGRAREGAARLQRSPRVTHFRSAEVDHARITIAAVIGESRDAVAG